MEEAEGYARRALQIEEATLQPDDMRMADTMHLLAQCIRRAGKPDYMNAPPMGPNRGGGGGGGGICTGFPEHPRAHQGLLLTVLFRLISCFDFEVQQGLTSALNDFS